MEQGMVDMLTEKTLEIIIIFDNEGIILECNHAALKHLGYQELRGISVGAVLRKEFENDGTVSSVMQSLMLQEEAALYRCNDTCFRAAVQIGYDEQEKKFYLFALDLEEGFELGAEVARVKEIADKAMMVKNEFVANVTHELKTPLNGIRGHIENLKETRLTTEQRKTMEIIELCCGNMASIINNILDFSKLQSGKIELENRSFCFAEMMKHITEANIASVNEKGLKLTVNIDETIPEYVVGDELRLTQILNNLISNAVKFTSVGFIQVEVTATVMVKDEIELFFMVVDSGIGIAKEDQEHLFQSFSQVDASITRKYGGTGLGLAITKELVEMMNGKIYLQSEKGRGSNFSFSVRLHIMENSSIQREYSKEVRDFLEWRRQGEQEERIEEYYHFGSEENKSEIKARMEKIVLCIEMEVWDKAEMWAGELKTLVEKAEDDKLRKAILRLEMSIRKEDYAASMSCYQRVGQILEEIG